MKQRMTTADVSAEVACLRDIVCGMRVANIYDIDARVYLFKLSQSGEDGQKIFLLLESGLRFHTTQYLKDRSSAPSNFTLKLRKHLRTRRLTEVRQLGLDRIVDFTFGSGDTAHHLLLELYSQGNVVLTDSKYEVLTLLRSHRDDDKGMALMPRHPYPIHTIRLRTPLDADQLAAAVGAADAKATIKGTLASILPYGPALSEHCILQAGLEPGRSPSQQPVSAGELEQLMTSVRGWEGWLDGLKDTPPKGYISYKPADSLPAAKTSETKESTAAPEDGKQKDEPAKIFEAYDALILQQHKQRPVLEFDSFDVALDEFHGKIEGQRAVQARTQKERAAMSKLDKLKADQAQRADTLAANAMSAEEQAQLIEYNLDAVDGAINAVRAALAQGLDWKELERLIETETRAGNPVAGMVESLRLDVGRVTLLLSNDLDEEECDEDALARPATRVEVEIDINAAANARNLYANRKANLVKQQKTLDANDKAFKAAEKKATQQLNKVAKSAVNVQQVRKPLWFEKFFWFVSSENYLVVSGRDAQQNELLVKRHLSVGDAYVHADLHGAPSTIVKNPHPDQPVPPLTLSEAGSAAICRSNAWDSKIITSAWWVQADQVSKSAPSGESLATGSFVIRGQKSFLPPARLVMGFGFLFRLDESSMAAHLGERSTKGIDGASSVAGVEDLGLEDDNDDDENDEDANQDEAADHESADSGDEGAHTSTYDTEEAPSAGHTGSQQPGSASTRTANGEDDPAEASAEEEATATETEGEGAGTTTAESGDEDEGETAESEGEQDPMPASVEHAGAASSGRESGALEAFMDSAADPYSQQYQRYGLPNPNQPATSGQQATAESQEAAPSTQDHRQHRHLSAKQKKLAKKQGGLMPQAAGAGDNSTAAAAQQSTPEADVSDSEPKPTKAEAGNQALKGRGKRSKARKAKDKYAEQDDEDRALALQLLGSAGQPKAKPDRKEARKQRQSRRKANQQDPEKVLDTTAPTPEQLAAVGAGNPDPVFRFPKPQKKGAGRVDGGGLRDRQDASAAAAAAAKELEGPPAEASSSVATEGAASSGPLTDADVLAARSALHGANGSTHPPEEHGEAAAILAEENVELMTEDERTQASQLDTLTGAPLANDILLHALPVCGPYSALQTCRFKLKLVPGSQKKGKAARQATELLTKNPSSSSREIELMKAVPEMESINCFVGGVKLAMPGMQQRLKRFSKKRR
ncbi:hypothetical protein WJX74_008143 [Apatococcus lobatus]|uniref:Nuclear export mediator factor NEMF n=1 Tax=Apatococcus lobatus TaxID=904363 RepID=A0AAW1S6I4_9CHLO